MAHDTLTCDEHIGNETLSAWRDALLPENEMRRIALHAATCPACRAQLAAFDDVASALHRQADLEPDGRILAGVRQRIALRRRLRWPRLARAGVWRGLGALGSVAALLLLFVYVFHAGPISRPPRIAATVTWRVAPTSTAPATATATAASGNFTVADPAVARYLSFAFVRDNDVWVSSRGAQPRQMTHFGLSGQQLYWRLSWSADQTRILAWAFSDTQPNQPANAWSVSVADDSVTPLPAALAQACAGGLNCYWFTDRYIVHYDTARSASHAQYLKLFDVQTGHDIATVLDNEEVTEVEVRGSSLYYTPYAFSSLDTSPGTIWRFDSSTNTLARVFTVPGPLVSQGLPDGSWDLSQSAQQLVVSFGFNVTARCPISACHAYYQSASGTVAAILTAEQGVAQLTISPDGTRVATVDAASPATILQPASGYSLIQAGLPSGSVLSTALPPTPGAQYSVLGWTPDSAGILVEQAQVDQQENTHPAAVYVANAGSGSAAHLVETLPAGDALTFAPARA